MRPLSAKRLPPTLPETRGWIDRERLRDFQGRTRKPQMALAAELGITEYATPAGGCLLTDPGFGNRLRDLATHMPEWGADDARLLRVGRHFRIGPATKIVASRCAEEGDAIEALARPGEPLFLTRERPGALILVRGVCDAEAERLAAGLAVHYSKFREAGAGPVERWPAGSPEARAALGEIARIDPSALKRLDPHRRAGYDREATMNGAREQGPGEGISPCRQSK